MWNVDLPDTLYLASESSHDEKVAILNELRAAKHIAIDTETTGLTRWRCYPLYWSLAWGDKRATLHADTLPYFIEIFADPSKVWILANAKFDMHMLANVGIHLAGEWHDVQVMHAQLYEDKPHKLKFIAKHLLDWTWADFQDQFGKIGKKQSAEDILRKAERENMDLLIEYAANDAWGTLKVWEELKHQLEDAFTYSLFSDHAPYINTLWDFFYKVEMPYTRVLWKMERRGIKIDRSKFAAAKPEAEQRIKEIEKQIVKQAGFMLNINSTPQMRKYFFDVAKLKPISMSDGGKTGVRQPQVNANFLEHYKHENDVAALVLEHRKLSKLYGTYIVGLDALVDPFDRIHTSFNQDVARTGRLSSSEPNLQ